MMVEETCGFKESLLFEILSVRKVSRAETDARRESLKCDQEESRLSSNYNKAEKLHCLDCKMMEGIGAKKRIYYCFYKEMIM